MGAKPGRGWGTVVGLALTAVLLSVASPGLLIFVPLSLMLVALPPRRPELLALGGVLALSAFLGPREAGLWYVERGWALVLGAWFVVAVAVWPRAGFLSRALAALAATAASTALCLVLTHGGWSGLDWLVSRRLRDAAGQVASLGGAAAGAEWIVALASSAYEVADLRSRLHPALQALASLAGLAVAWWAYRRLAWKEQAPLGRFREFRFRDELIWVLIAGAVLVVLPLGEEAVRTGSNLLVFMGALYALRGAAVLVALLGVAGLGGIVFALLALLFLPMVMAATMVVGLTDTWLDLRARRSMARPGS